MADSAPSRDPACRLAIRASVLVMMLVSVSAHASARGLNEVSHSARVALQARLIADRLLPVQTEAGLARGVRFEIPGKGDEPSGEAAGSWSDRDERVPAPRRLRESLLSLPPPAC